MRKLEATVSSQVVPLSVLEFTLVKFFVVNKERVMSRVAILEEVWQGSHVSSRTIDTHMVYLRKKLEGFDHTLSTVYGAGYILRSASQMPHAKAASE
jgi:DNA-binding response OmpR family regulator